MTRCPVRCVTRCALCDTLPCALCDTLSYAWCHCSVWCVTLPCQVVLFVVGVTALFVVYFSIHGLEVSLSHTHARTYAHTHRHTYVQHTYVCPRPLHTALLTVTLTSTFKSGFALGAAPLVREVKIPVKTPLSVCESSADSIGESEIDFDSHEWSCPQSNSTLESHSQIHGQIPRMQQVEDSCIRRF